MFGIAKFPRPEYSMLLNSGVGIGTVRRLLGHRNLQTTQRYAELTDETVRQELEAFARRKRRAT